MRRPWPYSDGFTLVEMLIAAALLGAVLALLGLFLRSNAQITRQQMSAADANQAVQRALLRLGDIVLQAHYIYPAGQRLSLQTSSGNRTVTTGADVLALLVPLGANYCRPETPTERYCGFVFSIEDRQPYTNLLGSSQGTTGRVLVEFSAQNLSWEAGSLPPLSWQSVTPGVLADSVQAAAQGGSSLAAPENLHLSTTRGLFDDEAGFTNAPGTPKTDPLALISAVEATLVVRYVGTTPTEVAREAYAFARAIPRGALPLLAP